MNKITFYITMTFMTFMASWVPPAMAYIDPGSGSAIMSAIVGGFVAVSLAIKTYWYKIKSLFVKGKSKKVEEENKGEK
ncbi:hypothetical protein AB4407_06660 [Vibrio sp. 10N.261.46.E11]|uniref:hypothetical protein n=1 Tax=Vibrio sp. 10N.261.46.E11 TaxID=3229662 RepID=UPI00354D428E